MGRLPSSRACLECAAPPSCGSRRRQHRGHGSGANGPRSAATHEATRPHAVTATWPQVLKALGRGSYGTVYKVQRLADSQAYAMKETDIGKMSHQERSDAGAPPDCVNDTTRFLFSSRPRSNRLEACNRGFLSSHDSAALLATKTMPLNLRPPSPVLLPVPDGALPPTLHTGAPLPQLWPSNCLTCRPPPYAAPVPPLLPQVNEIRVLGSLRHPNVVRQYETFMAGNKLCIVMELAPAGGWDGGGGGSHGAGQGDKGLGGCVGGGRRKGCRVGAGGRRTGKAGERRGGSTGAGEAYGMSTSGR
jgi:serine/threonine protein kinase